MAGGMQKRYLHGVPAGGSAGVRINLTFRVCKPRVQQQQLQPQQRAGEGGCDACLLYTSDAADDM
eukprot:13562322-Alexandrium_andersonii.AAC.1